MRTVAVIGSGVSGLVSTKSCIEEGFQPVCFERRSDLGGLWNYTKESVAGQSSVSESTLTNTSKEMMCISDFPFPKEFPIFLPHSKVLEYLKLYAAKYDLLRHTRFNTEVVSVERSDNFQNDGGWIVTTKDRKNNTTQTESYDGIIICCGLMSHKYIPDLPGLKTFTGKVVHTQDFKNPKGYEDKSVLVVGLGNSGADAAVDLSSSSKVYLSTRSGGWMFGRISEGGLPLDMKNLSRMMAFVRSLLPWSVINHIFKVKLNKVFNHRVFGLEPKTGPLQSRILINDELPLKIVSGKVVIKGDIKEIRDKRVTFTDGSLIENVDVIVFATGYKPCQPEFTKGIATIDVTRLYKMVVPPDMSHPRATLGFVGTCGTQGPVFPLFELQARYLVQVFKKNIVLPPKEKMRLEIDKFKNEMKKFMFDSKGDYVNVRQGPYQDEMAGLIGCRPNIVKLVFTDLPLAIQCYCGPLTPCQYRLQGPGKWSGAREAIMTSWDRALFPYRNDNKIQTIRKPTRSIFTTGLAVVVLALAFYKILVAFGKLKIHL